jgi:hypothetical protein
MSKKDDEAEGVIANLVAVCKFSVTKRMRILLPEILWCGVSIAYYSAMLILMISDTLAAVGDDDSE